VKRHQHKKEPCPSCTPKAKKWYKERVLIVSFIVVISLIVSYFVPFLKPFFDAFIDYLKIIWWAILLGLFLGGMIEYFVPTEYVSKYLAAHKKRTIFYSVILGFFMSACSHGILALAIQFYNKVASTPSVIAFLLAAPWANLTITIMLFGFFGIKALYLVVSAMVVAVITGLIFQVLNKRKLIEQNPYSVKVKKEFSILKDIKIRMKKRKEGFFDSVKGILKGTWSLSKMVLWWILIGMFIASLGRAFVPAHWFHNYLGASFVGLIITLLLAIVIEVCSEGSAPLAFEIFRQTGAFGNAVVFLMAGVATDYTEIGLIWSNIGKKTAIWLPVITVPQILLLGYLFNILL
jgi:uncharacterized membrane protein YraQ (UPF0718 family)